MEREEVEDEHREAVGSNGKKKQKQEKKRRPEKKPETQWKAGQQ